MDNLHFAEKVFHQCALMLCPKSHTATKYFSLNYEHVLGYSRETLMQMSIPDFFLLIHPEDLPAVQQCLDFRGSCPPFDRESIDLPYITDLEKKAESTFTLAMKNLPSKPEITRIYTLSFSVMFLKRRNFVMSGYTYTKSPRVIYSNLIPTIQNNKRKL